MGVLTQCANQRFVACRAGALECINILGALRNNWGTDAADGQLPQQTRALAQNLDARRVRVTSGTQQLAEEVPISIPRHACNAAVSVAVPLATPP